MLWFIAYLVKVFHDASWRSKCSFLSSVSQHGVNWTCNVRKVSIWKCEIRFFRRRRKNIYWENSLPLRHWQNEILWTVKWMLELENVYYSAEVRLQTWTWEPFVVVDGDDPFSPWRSDSKSIFVTSFVVTFANAFLEKWKGNPPRHSYFIFNYVLQIEFFLLPFVAPPSTSFCALPPTKTT